MTRISKSEAEKVQEMSQEIIRCLTEHDRQALKNLFCEQSRSQPRFDNELDALLDYFRCDTYINADIDGITGGGGHREYGEWLEWYVIPEIPYIEVILHSNPEDFDPDTGAPLSRYYSVCYFWQITKQEDPSLEGLQYLRVELLNSDHYVQVGCEIETELQGPSVPSVD
ncbi:MAG: DUF5104 domain-containing protein [Clostridiales bacterium]|nr:DUF5104 domain-containing protein [Clostridiales bacterium]